MPKIDFSEVADPPSLNDLVSEMRRTVLRMYEVGVPALDNLACWAEEALLTGDFLEAFQYIKLGAAMAGSIATIRDRNITGDSELFRMRIEGDIG